MSISLKTQKMLWGRAAARCSFALCRITLAEEGAGVLGEAAHIVAESPDGPRASNDFPADKLNEYDNLILLCPTHHTEIDRVHPDQYSPAKLHEIKDEHERWVKDLLAPAFDQQKERDDEVYAELVDQWVSKASLDNWTAWSFAVFYGDQPRMSQEMDAQFDALRNWLLRRIWPGRYSGLENSFENFRLVLTDFIETFRKFATPHGDTLITDKFHQIREYDPERYQRLLKEYEKHVGLVCNLMVELTRAANYVCDEVRAALSPRFRLDEGKLAVESGPYIKDEGGGGLIYRTFVPEYSSVDRSTDTPYSGLEHLQRDVH